MKEPMFLLPSKTSKRTPLFPLTSLCSRFMSTFINVGLPVRYDDYSTGVSWTSTYYRKSACTRVCFKFPLILSLSKEMSGTTPAWPVPTLRHLSTGSSLLQPCLGAEDGRLIRALPGQVELLAAKVAV